MTRRRVPLVYRHRWALLVAGILLPAIANAAGLTITPPSIAANYSGTITLNISGLSSGQTVLMEVFLDLNGNAVVESGETLVQSFQVTDGQALSIGGVRNTNVPGDEDGAVDGKIRSVLSFGLFAEANQAVAKYIYKVSPATSGFAPVTAVFTITQPAYAQKVVGKVTSGGVAVPYAFTFLVPSLNQNPEGAALADANGNFTLNAATGTHFVLAIKEGFVTDFSAPPAVTVNAGATVTQNLSLTAANRTISGRLTNVVGGAGIPGVQMSAQSENGLFAFAFSNANGDFVAPVSSASAAWNVRASQKSLALLGHLVSNDSGADISGGNVSGLSVQAPQATALIYGSLKDAQENPLAGLSFYADHDQYEGYGRTDVNGSYVVGVIPGTWSVGPDSADLAALGYLVQHSQVTANTGNAVRQDIQAQHFTAHLSGRVTDETSQAVEHICINAYSEERNVDGQTDANGNFSFGVVGGTWYLKLCSDDAQQRGLVGPTLQYAVQDGVDVSGIAYVARRATAHITGWVRDTTNAPIVGIGVTAHLPGSGIAYDLYNETDSEGRYSIGAFNGTWQVELSCGDLQSRGYSCVSGQSATIAGADAVANFTVPLPGVLQITTTSLPSGTQGAFYGVQLNASGGVQQYNWDLAPGSLQLPSWLNLSSNGYLSGTPTNGGAFNFTVRVTDAASHSAVQGLSLFITGQSLQITTSGLPSGQVDVAYTTQLQASGGEPPYSWSLTPGSGPLPAGLNLASNGGLGGTPTSYGTVSFYIRLTDSTNNSVDRNFSISISPAPLELLTGALPNGHVGSPYSSQLQATGGVQPYTWMLAPGSLALPPGLMLDPGGGTPTTSTSGGLISGTPTVEGSFSFIVRVSDSYGQYIDRPLTVVIGPSQGTPTVTPTPTRTPTRTATPTPGPCFGDCNRNEQVTTDELVQGLNIALGHALLDACARLDCNGTGTISVNCLIKAVDATLYGCVGAPP